MSELHRIIKKNWPHNPTNFGTVKLTRKIGKSKFAYNGQLIAFDGKCMWSFGNSLAMNVVICGADNTK